MTSTVYTNSMRFIALVFVQVLICNNINFLGYINPYIYILFILLFPVRNNKDSIIILSFLLGLTIDLFQDTGGIHAAACVFIAYIRPVILKFSFGMMYDHQTIKFDSAEFGAKLTYITILTFVHHLILFSLEGFSFTLIFSILIKTVFSSIFTILLCIIITIIFRRKK